MPAPGQALGGWCEPNSNTVFGQWLSGLSRMACTLDDQALRDKVAYLFTEWSKTVRPDGNCGMGHYPFEKLICGLVDMQLYGGFPDTTAMMGKVTDYAIKNLRRDRVPAAPRPWGLHSGTPGEWYTVGENLYRAFQLTGNVKYKDFAEVWHYTPYWNKFAETSAPGDAWGVHAYSHLNSFSSAGMAYAVSGDTSYLRILKNAYDFMQNTQCYATGGIGPAERIMPSNGNLGKALDYHQNSCETPCCSWASFKMARYLTQFTGEARYGDWVERLLYNGVGGILPIRDNGRHFYYADYRVSGGVKVYARGTYTCCSGTYCQAVADYPNQIYYKDDSSLYVSLYLPSEVKWDRAGGAVKVTQETRYPQAETSTFTVDTKPGATFTLKFRVPGWSNNMSVKINGETAESGLPGRNLGSRPTQLESGRQGGGQNSPPPALPAGGQVASQSYRRRARPGCDGAGRQRPRAGFQASRNRRGPEQMAEWPTTRPAGEIQKWRRLTVKNVIARIPSVSRGHRIPRLTACHFDNDKLPFILW